MKQQPAFRSLRNALAQFLTPSVYKQAHQAERRTNRSSRWTLQPLLWVLLTMAWCSGDSQEERFASARAVYVACHQHERRPGTTLSGFLQALARLPLPVLRVLARAIRQQLAVRLLDALRLAGGWLPMACDGSRLECPRSAELQQRLGEAGKPGSAPSSYLTTLVLLPLGLVWSWWWGKGTASEHTHLRCLLATLPPQTLLVMDAASMGYALFTAIVQVEVKAGFLVRLSSRAYLYTLEGVALTAWTEGVVYYWPAEVQKNKLPPIEARLLRVPGDKVDVWLLTSVLDPKQLSRKMAAQIYRWRWRNEGLFRDYKRLLHKVKLQSRTVALVHREAEGSLLALQLLLALAAQPTLDGRRVVLVMGSGRRQLLRLRAGIARAVRSLGPRQFAAYEHMLMVVRSDGRKRSGPKIRQDWPRRKPHKPPKPPKLRVMSEALQAKLHKQLNVA